MGPPVRLRNTRETLDSACASGVLWRDPESSKSARLLTWMVTGTMPSESAPPKSESGSRSSARQRTPTLAVRVVPSGRGRRRGW